MDNEPTFPSSDMSIAEPGRPLLFLEMIDIDGRRYHRIIRPDGTLGRWMPDENTPRIRPKYTIEY